MQKKEKRFSARTMKVLQNYTWPGNIRELDNTIQRAVVLATEAELTPDLFPLSAVCDSVEEIGIGLPLEEALLKFKKQFIEKTLQYTKNNQTQAAEILKIQRTYLNRLINEFKPQ